MDFYKDAYGWKIGGSYAPAGVFVLSIDEQNNKIYVDGLKQIANGVKITEITKNIEGDHYTDIAEFVTITYPFFAANPNISLGDSYGDPLTSVNPLHVTLGTVYSSDIDFENSDFTNWIGNPEDLFGNINNGGVYNETTDNPKIIILRLKRTRTMRNLGIGTNTGNFSNLKVTFLGSGNSEKGYLDLSDDSSKEKSMVYSQEEFTFNAIKIEFHTVDRIDITNFYINYTLSNRKQDYILKWGVNPDIDTGSIETVWDLGDEYIFTQTAQNYYISSSNNSDTTQTIEVELIILHTDGRYKREIIEVQINGNTKTLITASGLAIASNRALNISTDVLLGDIYIYEDTTVTAGVPDDLTKVRSMIITGKEQTQQAVYTVPEILEDNRKIVYAELYKWDISAIQNKTTSGLVELIISEKNKTARVQDSDALTESRKSGNIFGENTPLIVQPGSDIFINVSNLTVSDVAVKAGFTIKLVVL